MTPREAARDLLRADVLNGNSLALLRWSELGCDCPAYAAQIGGVLHAGTPHVRLLRADEVGVERVGETPCSAVFALTELVREIKAEAQRAAMAGRPVQERML